MPRTFYRITDQPPSLENFTSAKDRGQPPPRRPEHQFLWDGISVYATLAQARAKALDFPMFGSFIAELSIPDRAPFRIERTLPGSRGHHTIWGDPAALLACVVSVVPV